MRPRLSGLWMEINRPEGQGEARSLAYPEPGSAINAPLRRPSAWVVSIGPHQISEDSFSSIDLQGHGPDPPDFPTVFSFPHLAVRGAESAPEEIASRPPLR
jgi:hypothetical protein